MIKRILVGLGGTPFTAAATQWATELGDLHQAQLTGVTIVNTIVLNDLILGFLSDAHDLNLPGCRWAICPQNDVPNLSAFL